ncbi:hypothetical protein CBR_g3310 [Chara braunii]|uniref:Uncharacterized protein n=1 Tax=Chara braunii TaxID=69332 RepID=A0A388KFE2_CHABU|nr:hypothetical protein CBR_g3310 [Chara braunii]|eukprot:GBG68770.1 hypothetical protein CBR_g3310 [Chara braunii]
MAHAATLLTSVEAQQQREVAMKASRSAWSPAYVSLSSNHLHISRKKSISFCHVEGVQIALGLRTGLALLPTRHSYRSSSGTGTTSGLGKHTYVKGRRVGRETLWWAAKNRPISETSVQSEGYYSLDDGDEGDAGGDGFGNDQGVGEGVGDDLGVEGGGGASEASGGPETFLSLAEAGLVELAPLDTHEKFLARLTISSLNLLRTISRQEGVPIKELNAGRIVDWFTKDKMKRENGSDSAVLKW